MSESKGAFLETVRQHLGRRWRESTFRMFDIARLHPLRNSTDGQEACAVASDEELGGLALAAMAHVRIQDRMVLALRFFEDMPYAEIARILGCSEIRVRLKFLIAKWTLARELKRLGM